MSGKPKGHLIIIGGHEEKQGDEAILKAVAQRARGDRGHLVIVTVATQEPEEVGREYRALFRGLGVGQTDVVDIRTRDEAAKQQHIEKIANAKVVFFTGGDQLRITSQIGDSPVFQAMRDIYQKGATIAGTSAGAAAMPETMLNGGADDQSHRISALEMAPGLAFLSGVVIDSHFAERGRMGRLLGAVAQNPRNIGLGIDEDTAIIVTGQERFEVIGSGAVYVVDGMGISYSSLSEEQPEGITSIFDIRLHVLGQGDHFDLHTRRPLQENTR
ncbi:MAG: cyanophycinase [Roseiflexaceae bacterium]